MSDDRRFIEFSLVKASVSDSALRGNVQVRWELAGESNDYDLCTLLTNRYNVSKGLKVYETEGILQDAINVLQQDLEKEKQRHADAERLMQDRITELEAGISYANRRAEIAMTENIRLKGIEKALEELAGLQVPKVVR